MEIPDDVKEVIGNHSPSALAITVRYKNYRGEISIRKIIPLSLTFDSTEYHKEKQWLLEVWDLEKLAHRTYALKDIEEWISFPG